MRRPPDPWSVVWPLPHYAGPFPVPMLLPPLVPPVTSGTLLYRRGEGCPVPGCRAMTWSGTQPARPLSFDHWTPRGLAPAAPAMPRVGLGPRVSPPRTGPAAPAHAHHLDHGGRLGAYSTMSAPPFSAIPVTETSVLLVARRPVSPSSWPAVPPLGCVGTVCPWHGRCGEPRPLPERKGARW